MISLLKGKSESITAPARSRPKWHYLYYLLAAFDLCTVSLSLYLNHQLMSSYTQSVAVNQDWARRLQSYSELSQLAVAANAPGNDVFESGKVELESQRLQVMLDLFSKGMERAKQELHANVEASLAQLLLEDLQTIETAMAQMAQEANLIFSYFERNQPELAGRRMALMDRRSHEASLAFARLRQHVSDIQQQLFDEQIAAARSLKKFEYSLAMLIVLMVIGIAVYGNKLAHKVESEAREKEEYIEKLHVTQSNLNNRTQVLEQTLEKLQQTQVQMIQSEKMSSLGQLVAGVAHEINNPVNFIHGNIVHAREYIQDLLEVIQVYQQNYSNPPTEIIDKLEEVELEFLISDLPKTIDSMQVGSDRLHEIVLSLRNFSRLDEAELKEFDIHSGIDSTLMILQNRLKAQPHRGAIQVIKEYDKLPLVECYPGQLSQVFMNIIGNAIDALEDYEQGRSPAEREANPINIRIQTEVVERDAIAIKIADNGMGIDSNVSEKLFDAFFTTKPVGKGTGLGLSISHSIIVEKHQGKIECFSARGEGAEFRIEIPIRQNKSGASPVGEL